MQRSMDRFAQLEEYRQQALLGGGAERIAEQRAICIVENPWPGFAVAQANSLGQQEQKREWAPAIISPRRGNSGPARWRRWAEGNRYNALMISRSPARSVNWTCPVLYSRTNDGRASALVTIKTAWG